MGSSPSIQRAFDVLERGGLYASGNDRHRFRLVFAGRGYLRFFPWPQFQPQHQRVFIASDGKALDCLCGIACNIPGPEAGGPRTLTFEGKGRWAKCVRVGCFSPNGQTCFHGDISEILVYTRRLTDAEKNRLAVYLMGKWGL